MSDEAVVAINASSLTVEQIGAKPERLVGFRVRGAL